MRPSATLTWLPLRPLLTRCTCPRRTPQRWDLEAFIIIFALFNALPCTLELLCSSFYLTGRLQEYRK